MNGVPQAYVRFSDGNLVQARTEDVSTTELKVTVPIGPSGAAQLLLVQQAAGTTAPQPPATTNSRPLTIRASMPVLTSIQPASAKPGDIVEVAGTNFKPGDVWSAYFVINGVGKEIPVAMSWVTSLKFKLTVPDSGLPTFLLPSLPATIYVKRASAASNALPFTFLRPEPVAGPKGGGGQPSKPPDPPVVKGYNYFGKPGCASKTIDRHPGIFLDSDAEGYFCCETSQGVKSRCGANRASFAPDCMGCGNPRLELIQPGGCYIRNSSR